MIDRRRRPSGYGSLRATLAPGLHRLPDREAGGGARAEPSTDRPEEPRAEGASEDTEREGRMLEGRERDQRDQGECERDRERRVAPSSFVT